MKKFLTIMILLLLAGVTGCKEQPKDLDRVNHQIDAFIETYLVTYVNDDKQDFYVTRAIAKLAEYGYDIDLADYVTEDTIKTTYDAMEYESIATIFQALMIGQLYDYQPSTALLALDGFSSFETWNHVIGYLSLKMTNKNITLQQSTRQQMLVRSENDYRDADFAGLALMATADETIDRTLFLGLISDAVDEDGIKSGWGGANSCSTSMAILGYLAIRENPRTVLTVDLISALLEFFEEGAARYELGEEVDLLFSTPQAFSALVAYKIYAEKSIYVNLFN
ncbi:MAG: hypothetical protein WCQ80_00955 [Bacilli bacterium]